MKLRKVSGCADSDCPAVYISDRGTAVVQGDWITEADGLSLAAGETAVELPPEIILNAVAALIVSGANPDGLTAQGDAEVILDGDQFGKRFSDYQRSAWRFECQPTYNLPREQENLELWRSGAPAPEGHNAAWHDRVRSFVSAGKTIGRVRTVRQPLTEYQRYQLDWAIPGNIEAGEDIRILDLMNIDLDPPSHDFWIFDESLVVDLNFNPDGTLLNRDQREKPDLTQYLK